MKLVNYHMSFPDRVWEKSENGGWFSREAA